METAPAPIASGAVIEQSMPANDHVVATVRATNIEGSAHDDDCVHHAVNDCASDMRPDVVVEVVTPLSPISSWFDDTDRAEMAGEFIVVQSKGQKKASIRKAALASSREAYLCRKNISP